MRRKKNLIAAMLAVVIMITPLLSVVPVAAEEEATPKLTFSGIKITQAADDSYQAVYSLRLEDADAMGVGFTLHYDATYLQPSKFDDNSLFTDVEVGEAFRAEVDPEDGLMLLEDSGDIYCSIGYPTDAMTGTQEGGFLIGQFSFRLQDGALAQLSAMSQSELAAVVTLQEDTYQPLQVTRSTEDENSEFYLYEDPRWIARMELKLAVTAVEPNITPGRETVTAQAIYQDGTVNDLFSYVQTNVPSVTVTYLGGSTAVLLFAWSEEEMSLSSDSPAWDPKGGTYTVQQAYPDTEFAVEVEIEVKPVSVTKFTPEPATLDYITYDTDEDPDCKPVDMNDPKMQFPTQVTPVYDTLLVGYTPAPVDVYNAWEQTDPSAGNSFFAEDAEGEYTFQAPADTAALPEWATVPANVKVEVKRFIGQATDTPADITAAVDDNGDLVITVNQLGDGEVPEGTTFFLRLPDGTDVTVDPSYVTIADGVATLMIPNSALPTPKTGQAINLGADDAAPFQVAAQVTDPELQGRSEFADVTFAPRNNYYDFTEKEFDYAGTNKGKFRFTVGATLPLEITLPGTDYVETTYDGATGAMGGKLQTVKVSEWTLVSGDPSEAGETVVYRGTLVDNTVPGYGDVKVKAGTEPAIQLKLETVEAQNYSVLLKTNPADGSRGKLTFTDGTSGPSNIAEQSTVQLKCGPLEEGYSITWETDPAGIQITQDAADETLFSFLMPSQDVTITAKIVSDSASGGTLGFYGKTRDEPTEETPEPPWVDTLIDTLYTTAEFADDKKLTADEEHPTAFDPEVSEYWIRVGNDTEQFKIEMTASGAGGTLLVYAPGEDGSFPALDGIDPATATVGAGGLLQKVEVSANALPATDYSAVADSIPLAPAVEASTNDFLVVMAGGATSGYIVHVQRLAKAEIRLNYGNSPYGLIMADDKITDKAAAKAAFVSNGNRFTADNLPDGGYTNVIYQLQAWGDDTTDDTIDYDDPDTNLDRNDHAIFVYNREDFVDPGFTAKDSLGRTLAFTSVTREFKADVMSDAGMNGLDDDTVSNETIAPIKTNESNETNETDDGRDTYDMSGEAFSYGLRPGIYRISYKFTDPTLPETDNEIVMERYVVVLNMFGDADNDTGRGGSDATAVLNLVAGRTKFPNYKFEALFRFRVMDADNDNGIGGSDATAILNVVAGRSPALRFYKSLAP